MTPRAPTGELAPHLRTGQRAEEQARDFLERQGLRFLERNFRARVGEIDLIMDDAGTRVFVEVRFRRNRRYGGALESVDRKKRARLLATAQWYLGSHRTTGPARFDVVAVEPGPNGDPCFVWIKNALEDG
ncbi:YraN family protein [Methylolobus aquaticus]